jgi:DNA-directed RNA polymerase subunit RPC12/RpoP
MVNMLARTGKRSTSYSPGSMFNARIVNCLAGEWLDAAGGTVYKLRRDHWQDRLWVVGNVLNDEDHDGMVFARGAYDSHWVVKRAQAAGDYTCPNCGGPHLEGDGFDPEGTQVSQEIVCNDCSAAFTATYTLTAFVFDAARSDQ